MLSTATSTPVQAVLFDYGLVLTGPPDPAAWADMKQTLAADEPTFHEAYWRFRHDYDRGTLNGTSYWQHVAAAVDRELTPNTLDALINADTRLWTQPNQPMIDWAARLQAAGIRTGILSNLGDAMETGVRAHCTWLAAFSHQTFSHRLFTAKPDLAIYAHAAQGLGVPREAILFIDDREDNIQAARTAGMQAVQYTGHEAFLEAMQQVGLASLLHSATIV